MVAQIYKKLFLVILIIAKKMLFFCNQGSLLRIVYAVLYGTKTHFLESLFKRLAAISIRDCG